MLLSHLPDVYSHLGPNELTKLRRVALSNNFLARVIKSLCIHRLFSCSVINMKRDNYRAATAVLNENEDECDICTEIKVYMVPRVDGGTS